MAWALGCSNSPKIPKTSPIQDDPGFHNLVVKGDMYFYTTARGSPLTSEKWLLKFHSESVLIPVLPEPPVAPDPSDGSDQSSIPDSVVAPDQSDQDSQQD